jgi:hypothetical protein
MGALVCFVDRSCEKCIFSSGMTISVGPHAQSIQGLPAIVTPVRSTPKGAHATLNKMRPEIHRREERAVQVAPEA